MKKSLSAIFKIMNINVDFKIFMNASHSVLLKKHQNKIKTKTFLENRGQTFVENAIILGLKTIRLAHFVNTRFILSNPRFNKGFKAK